MTVKLLDWDSQHFGYQVGCISLMNDTSEDVLISILAKECPSYRLIYLFLPEHRTLSSSICKMLNCSHVDQKVIFRKKLTDNWFSTSCYQQIRSVMYYDYTKFTKLAVASGIQSRFKLDPHFSTDDFESMYEVWIKNSFNGQIAHNCFAYFDQQNPVGVVTVKRENCYATIGIIAVDSTFRGKRIGHELLYAAEKYAYENELREVMVATQQRNIGACHFYQQNGYLPKEIINIYHFWNNDYHPIQ